MSCLNICRKKAQVLWVSFTQTSIKNRHLKIHLSPQFSTSDEEPSCISTQWIDYLPKTSVLLCKIVGELEYEDGCSVSGNGSELFLVEKRPWDSSRLELDI
jgi:hypothetical protein